MVGDKQHFEREGVFLARYVNWIVLIGFALILLVIAGGPSLYRMAVDFKIQTDPGFSKKYFFKRALDGKQIDEILPPFLPPGKVYHFNLNVTKERILMDDLAVAELYGVRFAPGSSTIVLEINGVAQPEVKGFLGVPFADRKLDYSEFSYNVLEYDATNGIISDGDVIYVFDK